ncbi:replication initiator [Mycobacterium attenuatum]|uniref:replication initiator n=1 Tax=Mycobacterium attenuatum TaxID=2341086 RepID=UPI001FCE8E0D|nr:replication initiator [Mycobacterium attenuatum]
MNFNDVVTQMIRRAASATFETWWKKVDEVGFCANPIHLIGGDGLGRDHRVLTRCNNRRTIVCPSCSDLYARDTWQLIHAGLRGGHHEIPTTVAEHPQVFVTLTAPSFGAVHTTRTTGTCHPSRDQSDQCMHGSPRRCEAAHDHDDPRLGQPLCRDCYDYVGHVLFSWHAPEFWRRFTIQLRRLLSRQLRHRAENPKNTRVSFMKVVELQRRGLPHYHAVIRLDAASEPGQPPAPPDTCLSTGDFAALIRRAAIAIEITVSGGKVLRFGEQLDIKIIGNTATGKDSDAGISSRQIAGYLAKYVTKSVADFGVVARRFSPAAIDQLDVTEHVREIMRTIVALAEQQPHEEMLSWVHTLGYRGHVVSKSRQFSTTMTALRERRATWRKQQARADMPPALTQYESDAPMQWEFERLGHTTLGDRVLVLSAFARAQQKRFTARDALREGA